MKPGALKTFIIYSSKDKTFREELEQHLSLLTATGLIEVWSDREILPGDEWDKAIEKELDAAKLVLMLISVDFFNSEYIRHKEFNKAIAKRRNGDASVIPIIVRDCSWTLHPVINELQVLPSGAKPVNSRHWTDRDEAWSDVVRNIALFIQKTSENRPVTQPKRAVAPSKAPVPEQPAPKPGPPAPGPDAYAWKITERLDNEHGYNIFLEEHPDSPYAEKAKNWLAAKRALREAAAKEKAVQQAADDAAWKIALRSNSVVAYEIYIENHPDGSHEAEAKQKIKHLTTNGAVIRDGDKLPEMVFVQGGTFRMGSEESDNEKPPHEVRVSDFFIGKYPLTVAEFKQFIDATGYRTDADKYGSSYIWTGSSYESKKGVNWKCDVKGLVRPESDYNHPVIHISCNDAEACCQWLSSLTGQQYRLPSETEWEFAARGGILSKGFKYSGSDKPDEVGWFNSNSDQRTHRVGEKKANELGLHDMSGNVREWCQDAWHDNYTGAPADGSAWMKGGDATCAVLRGGSWYSDGSLCSVALRVRNDRYLRFNGIGVRLARAAAAGG
jgi:formylglycine-generating enzyme required for sulfatase activity